MPKKKKKDWHLPKFVPRSIRKIITRTRPLRVLGAASKRRVVWIHAPAGTGKSTLLASYLQSHRKCYVWYNVDAGDQDPASFFGDFATGFALTLGSRPDYPAFGPAHVSAVSGYARTFFRAHWDCVRAPLAIVLDDWHEAGDAEDVAAILVALLQSFPPQHRLYITSWRPPPPSVAKYLSDISVVRWDEIRFDDSEAKRFIAARYPHVAASLSRSEQRRLNRYVGGWIYAMILLLEGNADISQLEATPHVLPSPTLISYLASQVLTGLSADERDLLCAIAFLPIVSAASVEKLTGSKESWRKLQNLAAKHRLIDQVGREYLAIHPLLRTFLVDHQRGASGAAAWSRRLVRAAHIAAGEGLEETAIDLLVEADDRRGVAQLFAATAERLLNEGKHMTLRRWIKEMPAEALQADPWLQFWLGSSLAPFDPPAAQQQFALAYASFNRRREVQGMFSACAALLESVTLEWRNFAALDPLIDRTMRLWRRYRRTVPPEHIGRISASIFGALMWRRPEDKVLQEWADRLQAIAIQTPDPSQRILLICNLWVYYAVLIGDLENANGILEVARLDKLPTGASPVAKALWFSLQATAAWLSGKMEDSIAFANHGANVVQKEGIHVWDVLLATARVYATLTNGDRTRGRIFLDRLAAVVNPARSVDSAHLLYLQCLYEIDDIPHTPKAAISTIRAAIALAEKAGGTQQIILGRLALAQALHADGQTLQAIPLVKQALEQSRRMRSSVQTFQALLCAALIALDSKNLSRCHQNLKEALELGCKHTILNFNFFRPTMVARLLALAKRLALTPDVEKYIRTLIDRRGLLPLVDEAEERIAKVRIYTLGGFRIEGTKGPIELADVRREFLQTLVSFGINGTDFASLVRFYLPGSVISAAGKQSARTFFKSDLDTIKRRIEALIFNLRRNVSSKFIDRSAGHIQIFWKYCWVDAFAYRELAERLVSDDLSGHVEAGRLRERLGRLMAGDFLPGEGHTKVLEMRDQLNSLRDKIVRR